jgi:hypothetical protein
VTTRWPWGHGPAPALRCDECGKRIGARRMHCVINDNNLLCVKCLSSGALHTKYYPECPEKWHDMQDHAVQFATRAAGWLVISGQRGDQ